MNRYALRKTIEDEVILDTHYNAFLEFRNRSREGYYALRQEDVEFVEEVPETPTESEAA